MTRRRGDGWEVSGCVIIIDKVCWPQKFVGEISSRSSTHLDDLADFSGVGGGSIWYSGVAWCVYKTFDGFCAELLKIFASAYRVLDRASIGGSHHPHPGTALVTSFFPPP